MSHALNIAKLPTIERDGVEIPLTFAYAEAAAKPFFMYYETRDLNERTPVWTRRFTPRYDAPNKTQYWRPECLATPGNLVVQTTRTQVRLYVSSSAVPVCGMIGDNFLESDLEDLCAAWVKLPQGPEITRVLLERVDWLDANPMFRGIPVKQSKTEARKQGARDAD
jgi:hypothetical protein